MGGVFLSFNDFNLCHPATGHSKLEVVARFGTRSGQFNVSGPGYFSKGQTAQEVIYITRKPLESDDDSNVV